ncbi:MAG: hypothetical protein QNK05_25925 [Myxococcota bacterium]|nr:hypothetical protein [Myxococcota bacterium]
MADSPAFELACERIEADTNLERIETRGTVRLALKAAGFNASSISPDQLAVVVEKLLPGELTRRGVPNPGSVCARVKDALSSMGAIAQEEAPEALFVRMGGG